MRRVKFRITGCRRGVSGVIAGIFMVIVFLLIIVAQIMIHASQNEYHQAVEDRNQQDWERYNEKIVVMYARINSSFFNITVMNKGGVTARLVDVWLRAYNETAPKEPLWQRLYEISVYVEPGHYASFSLPDTFDEDLEYSLKIVTERGNVATSEVPYPAILGGGGGGGNIPIVMVPLAENFQYMDQVNAPDDFESAYVKPQSCADNHTLYRILVNNTTESNIELLNNCTMIQIATQGGQIKVRYIVQNTTTIWADTPVAFTQQILRAGNSSYVYFASGWPPDHPEYPSWWGEEPYPQAPEDDPVHGYYTVGFILWFRYVGETEIRNISLPPLVHEIY